MAAPRAAAADAHPDEGPVAPADLRRWPWALLAAGMGAAGGAAVALLVRRHVQADAPDAQEPHELQAVVDRPAPESAG